ncbi:hypothetical protein [Desulfosediminicola flagellatus]|uniref:hypothetical protein n=1 Tax=Desulfosediminicola flagellatus TaxID=2569541 RepID=UPI0010AD8304|nr:hypothetical protein [Desulfosediminicola flagellatus]
MKALKSFLLFIALATASVMCVKTLYDMRKESTVLSIPSISQLPIAATEALSLEFKSLTADYIMLHVLTFMGEKVIQEAKTTDTEWQVIHKALKTVIDLDPRATDPFILATTTLPWEAGMVEETNTLLLKVAEFRPDDYRPYFFLWYNYFHFLKDTNKASIYLQKSAAIKGSPTYLKPLAARMHLYSGQLEASLAYTHSVIETTTDESMRKYMMKRLDGLRAIYEIETAVRKFKEKFGSLPQYPQDLVASGVMKKLPRDPYGGKFFISKDGRVYTTSKLVNVKKEETKE